MARGRMSQSSKAAAVKTQTRRVEGCDYAKLSAAASETTASDRMARGGGVKDTLAEANESVLAAQ